MDLSSFQTVLRCERCNKPFDKHSSLKRHGYYCRSQKAGKANRSRSCGSCAKAKARCNNTRPECSRCSEKALKCDYSATLTKATELKSRQSSYLTTERRDTPSLPPTETLGLKLSEGANNDDNVASQYVSLESELGLASLESEFPDWDNLSMDLINSWDLSTSGKVAPYESQRLPPDDQCLPQLRNGTFHAMSWPTLSIPPSPKSTIRSLTDRPKSNIGGRTIANLIFQTLKSYPLMIMRDKTLPPFIHPCFPISGLETGQLEPVANCISLVHMIGSDIQGSRKLFWKNIRLECERLCAEYSQLDKWALLAAMQALSIYLLIRLSEGETDHNNFDFLLIGTITIVARQLAYVESTYYTQPAPNSDYLEATWKDWLFEESRRRLCVVYQVVNMLVYFEPAALCNHPKDLVLAPLPAKKQLWEAQDKYMWKLESEREPGPQVSFGLAANGDLVKIDEGRPYCGDEVVFFETPDNWTPSRSPANWDEWCAGMDGYGGLIMLAASLIA